MVEVVPAPERQSPLAALHLAAGARMVPFGGWLMPLEYPTGLLREHMACRETAALFDVSHLGTLRVQGRGAYDLLQASFTNDLSKIGPGRSQYTHLLDEDGSVVDDIIVWWVSGDRFDVMPNASNTERAQAAVGGEDVTAGRAVLALQGPKARYVMGQVVPEASATARSRVTVTSWRRYELVVAGTGYTGEDGLECAIGAGGAAELWEALVEAGAVPAGLGARDTLRLEAGLPLHGHELGPGITPLDAGLGWVVGWAKPGGFRGREALARQREAGAGRRLCGLVGQGRRPLRAGYAVTRGGGPLGQLTSGNFSPVLGRGIGMCFLPADVAAGTGLEVSGRGASMAATVVPLPFVANRRPTWVPAQLGGTS